MRREYAVTLPNAWLDRFMVLTWVSENVLLMQAGGSGEPDVRVETAYSPESSKERIKRAPNVLLVKTPEMPAAPVMPSEVATREPDTSRVACGVLWLIPAFPPE